MSYWRVPQMWKGMTVAVLASGPSMSFGVADSVRHLRRVAVNTTYRLAPDADAVYGSDSSWWHANPSALACPGIKCCIEQKPGLPPNVPDGVVTLRNTGRIGFDPDPGCARTIDNSGAVAIQIAVHAGAARILLLGFDMRGGHWHHDHHGFNPSVAYLQRCVVAFRTLARALPSSVDVLNCTPDSALDCFPRVSLAEALSEHSEAA